MPPDLRFHLSQVLISSGVLQPSGGTETELAGQGRWLIDSLLHHRQV
jgi:hypothetical protein